MTRNNATISALLLVLLSACSQSSNHGDAGPADGGTAWNTPHEGGATGDVGVGGDAALDDSGFFDGDSGVPQQDAAVAHDVDQAGDAADPQRDAMVQSDAFACVPGICDDNNECTTNYCTEGFGCGRELLSTVPCGADGGLGGICVIQSFTSTCRVCGIAGTPCCNPDNRPTGVAGTCGAALHCDLGSSEFYPNGTCW